MKKKAKRTKKRFRHLYFSLGKYWFYAKKYPQSIIKTPFFLLLYGPKKVFSKLNRINDLNFPANSISNITFFKYLTPKRIAKAVIIFFTKGPQGVIEKIKEQKEQGAYTLTYNEQYELWYKKNHLSKKELIKQRLESRKYKLQPKISLICPVFNTERRWLDKCIDSVINQSYPNWELVIVDDGSTKTSTLKTLLLYKNKDQRIRIKHLNRNIGIAMASQKALDMSSGEYIGLLDSDDELTRDALYEIVKTINKHPKADFIYSDEDKITEQGKLFDPFFKPDWSPNLLLSMMYTSHFTVYRKNIVIKAGGFDNKYTGSQDYDLALRVSEITNNIFHVSRILYHWRTIPTSAAFRGDVKGYPILNAKKALQAHLNRRGIKAEVIEGVGLGRWRIKYKLKSTPGVTIVLLTGGRLELLKNCLESIFKKTTYHNYRVLIVDNSCKEETKKYLEAIRKKQQEKVKFYRDSLKPFNFPALCNRAIKKIHTPYVLLLNDDTQVITPDWIENMLEHAQRKEVGIVGCKLLFPNNRIQHAGVSFGIYDNSGHAFKGVSNHVHYYFDFPHVIRDTSAVTFACVLMKTNLYKSMGGLDDKNFKVAFNDTDFCLRVRHKGLQIVYTPYSVLYHYESVTKPIHILPGEVESMTSKWSNIIKNDPFYNINLTRKREDYTLDIT